MNNNDLISRSKLQVSIRREDGIIVRGQRYIRADAVSEKISMAPGVDAVPGAHGRWKPDMYFDQPVIRCTACKCGFALEHRAEHFPYCPNCGAKMDGGAGDV